MAERNIRVVKISPYPIEAVIGQEGQGRKCKIVKLTPTGFLANTGRSPFLVNKQYVCQFFIPVIESTVKEEVIVVKTYDWYRGGKKDVSQKVQSEPVSTQSSEVEVQEDDDHFLLCEFHFRRMTEESRSAIMRFLKETKQLGRR